MNKEIMNTENTTVEVEKNILDKTLQELKELNDKRAKVFAIEELIKSLVYNCDPKIRIIAAKHGYKLDVLINDPDVDVRVAVVDRGYGLEKLINDENPLVRQAVALQGYGLDKLINDPNPYVRASVLEYAGVCNNNLVFDPSPVVRAAVAFRCYGLNKLVNDEDPNVRDIANLIKDASKIYSDMLEEILAK